MQRREPTKLISCPTGICLSSSPGNTSSSNVTGVGTRLARQHAIGARMAQAKTIVAYSDYKSPYAFLAKDLVYKLEDDFEVRVDWLPYNLDIPSYLGSARLNERGEVIESARNAHQWRRVRYSYMDCRRQARKPGLVIRGPQKIWNSNLAACGMLYAKRQGDAVLRRYHDLTFERFWKRELDIEDPAVVGAVLAEDGA